MTPAAMKRLHVFFAAHNARLHHANALRAGRPISWADAIEKSLRAMRVCEISHEAVERQIFPRARDRSDRAPTTSAELVLRRPRREKKA
jgi:hypothetical protein